MTIKTELPEAEWLDEEDEYEEYMPTFEHGVISATISRLLGNFLDGKNLGQVVDSTVEYRFLAKLKKQLRHYPDVSFVKQAHLPKIFRSYPELAPDLVVEVASPSDKTYDIQAKVKLYQKVGVSLIWIVYPYSRIVEIYRRIDGLVPQVIGETGTLDGEDIVPGFTLPLSKIFNYPTPPDGLDDEPDDAAD